MHHTEDMTIEQTITEMPETPEPPRFCRRLVCLSHATIANSSICA